MSDLPFIFIAAEFPPLQPEDVDRETELRDRYPTFYPLRGVQLYRRAGITSEPATTYAQWVQVCNTMSQEEEEARQEWKRAVLQRDKDYAQADARCEELRVAFSLLRLRTKPPQPRKLTRTEK